MKAPTDERIQKFLSRAGVCSRRKAEVLIVEGRVSVNNKVVTELGARVRPSDTVSVDGKKVIADVDGTYIALFKPAGVITSLDDPEGRAVVSELLPKSVGRVWPVGRLDWESEGLILMTNDGELTNLLTHPSGGVQKTYHVKLRGQLRSKDVGLERMRQGVTLDDGFETSSADVSIDGTTGKHTWVQVVLHEGHNRQIRKMAEAVGHTVLRLKRVEIGPLSIEGLRPGNWRPLYRDEVLALFEAAGRKPSALAAKYHPDKVVSKGGTKRGGQASKGAGARNPNRDGGSGGKPSAGKSGKAARGGSSKRSSGGSKTGETGRAGRSRGAGGPTGGPKPARKGDKKHKSAGGSRRSVRGKKK